MGYDRNKMFVAHNTVKVLPFEETNLKNKKSLLFIGTLYKSKGIMFLLECYKKLFDLKGKDIPLLRVVGGGDEFLAISDWIEKNGLSKHVKLEGAVYDEIILKGYFEDAIICVSPGQAGLSVQKSMGYGVPFVTNENAYTGGERLDIQNGVNGLLYKEEPELFDILADVCMNKGKYMSMGKKAYEFYKKNRTIEMMAQGVEEAVTYVLDKR
jgi:glycosyltransferase involved in cell wall biosynthesis